MANGLDGLFTSDFSKRGNPPHDDGVTLTVQQMGNVGYWRETIDPFKCRK